MNYVASLENIRRTLTNNFGTSISLVFIGFFGSPIVVSILQILLLAAERESFNTRFNHLNFLKSYHNGSVEETEEEFEERVKVARKQLDDIEMLKQVGKLSLALICPLALYRGFSVSKNLAVAGRARVAKQ